MRAIVVLAAVAAVLPVAATAGPAEPVYSVPAPPSHGQLPAGWGVSATLRGRSMSLGDGWTDDPRVQSHDIEAGYGWRGARASALIGYDQHDYGPKFDPSIGLGTRSPGDPRQIGSSGVLGLSFVMHR